MTYKDISISIALSHAPSFGPTTVRVIAEFADTMSPDKTAEHMRDKLLENDVPANYVEKVAHEAFTVARMLHHTYKPLQDIMNMLQDAPTHPCAICAFYRAGKSSSCNFYPAMVDISDRTEPCGQLTRAPKRRPDGNR